MNPNLGVDRVLRDYFADDGLPAPDRVLDLLEERITRQPQRRAWRLPWRDSTVNANLKPIVALAAVLVVAVAGFALLSQPSGQNVGVTAPTLSPSPSVASSPPPTPAWNRYPLCGSGDPPCAGPVGAGTYTSQGFSVPVTYTLTTPWINTSDWPSDFILYPDTPANRALHADPDADGSGGAPYIFVTPGAVVSPSDACDESDLIRVNANGFRTHFEARDGLLVTNARPITLGGLDGQQFDVAIEPGWTSCLPRNYSPRNPPGANDRFRYIVLDHPSGDSLVTITLWAPVDVDRFLAEAMPIVETFEFDLSQLPSPLPS